MTEKRFFMDKSADLWDRKENDVIVDFGYSLNGADCKWIIDLLNELHEENKQLREIIMELKTTMQFDIDNGIKKYHVKNLLEYLEDILKEIE